MQNVWLRAGTRALMQILGKQLAEDAARAEAATELSPSEERARFIVEAHRILRGFDRIDVSGDERFDAELARLAVATGQVWLELAEDGAFAGKDYVAHVLFHCGEGGYSGSPFIGALLEAIAAADTENRNLLATSYPEYVGLYRAITETADGAGRLRTLVGR